ncbi:bifunctional protein FolD 1, mitochondrial [Herrania umbratica]|uniref:Bifunctional protein FolD 1, mitochondrial n=1 Tax=Herrania umbratica TaxID=108875 RepID=A0A6J1BEF7_9ROSI|nr:bifunctional protein FolD 1, mitochondrial [Herrania umbratica]
MRMMVRSVNRKMAIGWAKESKGCLSSTMTRASNTWKDNQSSQILLSPPLVTLDLPDIWAAKSTHYDPLSGQKISNVQIATVINGKLIAEEIRSRVASEVKRMKECIGKVPGLAVILVGERRDSQTYVRNKIKACEEAGIKSVMAELPNYCAEDDVMTAVLKFNEDPSVHGILVQLPLPEHLDEEKILNVLSLEKDVDGFHPINMGNLAMRGREPLFIPCTPKGCLELLIRSGVEIAGKKAVVIGRSNIVGLPISLLLQRHHATVSIVHACTKNPEQITREADLVVSAAGVPSLIRSSWLKQGSVVIDVGTCPIEDPSSGVWIPSCRDVCYEEALRLLLQLLPPYLEALDP